MQTIKVNLRCSQDSFFVASEVLKWNLEIFSHKIIYPGKKKLFSELNQWETLLKLLSLLWSMSHLSPV